MGNIIKLYFCFPIGGPNNGVKIISGFILKFLTDSRRFDARIIDTSQATDYTNFGKFSLRKVYNILRLLITSLSLVKKADCVYLNITPSGIAFYRDIILLMICKFKRANITVHLHANGMERNINFFTQRLFKNIKLIVINKNQLKVLESLPSTIFMVPNSLPDNGGEDEVGIYTNEKLRLLFFSNLSKEKGVDLLLRLIDLIALNNISCEVNICGGIMEKSYETIILKSIEKNTFVRYHGAIDNERLKSEFFSKNDMLLFLSDPYYEVSPLVYIEALMNGLPIITTKQVVADEFVASECGYIIVHEQEIISIIQNLRDNASSLSRLKKNSRQLYISNYNFQSYIDQITTIILK
tara:strand:- start:39375 stop:40433 length:1059 start_codon:yes stop_codon:yes gene_type:complete